MLSLDNSKRVALQVHGGGNGGGGGSGRGSGRGGDGTRRFPAKAWRSFVEGRPITNSLVAYEEIEVFLCNLFASEEETGEDAGTGHFQVRESTTPSRSHYDSDDDDVEKDLKEIELKFAMFDQMVKKQTETEKRRASLRVEEGEREALRKRLEMEEEERKA